MAINSEPYLRNNLCWRFWHTDDLDGPTNMAVDEATLRHIEPGQVVLRTYTWNPGCLSIGCFQRYSDVNIRELESRGFDLVRRSTGGRAVLHDKELTYSIVVKAPHPILSKSVLESYYYLCDGIIGMLNSIGIQSEIKRNEDRSMSTPSCFTAPTFGDIETDGRKIVGSAQMRNELGLLQHGSIINSLSRVDVFAVLSDSMSKVGRLVKLSEKKMTSIEEVSEEPQTISVLSSELLKSFKKTFNIESENFEPDDGFWDTVKGLKNNKYAKRQWTEKR